MSIDKLKTFGDQFTAWESLAWITWRSDNAVLYFSTNGMDKWAEAKRGQWPKRLGKPLVEPAEAEREFEVFIQTNPTSVSYP